MVKIINDQPMGFEPVPADNEDGLICRVLSQKEIEDAPNDWSPAPADGEVSRRYHPS